MELFFLVLLLAGITGRSGQFFWNEVPVDNGEGFPYVSERNRTGNLCP